MKKPILKASLALMFTLVAAIASAQSTTSAAYSREVYRAGEDSLLYRMLTPEKIYDGVKYPLVVFLHGSGERGNDNEKQLQWGAGQFANPVNREKFPAYVVFPQCPEGKRWREPQQKREDGTLDPNLPEATPEAKMVRGLIMKLIKEGKVDPSRIYLMGCSMGGMGVFDMVCRYPDLFAVAVPICGSANLDALNRRFDTKWRIFHGDNDKSVFVHHSRDAYKTLKKNRNDVEYTEFAGCTHDSWNPAFNSPNFLKKIFDISRPMPTGKK